LNAHYVSGPGKQSKSFNLTSSKWIRESHLDPWVVNYGGSRMTGIVRRGGGGSS